MKTKPTDIHEKWQIGKKIKIATCASFKSKQKLQNLKKYMEITLENKKFM